MPSKTINNLRGFTLVESLVGIFVFLLIALAITRGYLGIFSLSEASRVKTAAALVANQQFELARNLPYEQVGLIGGVPGGWLNRTQTLVADGFSFSATTTIRNIDDPFDGTIGGTPNDLSPTDYKLMAIDLWCEGCGLTDPISFTATISPKNLESGTGTGALFVRVLDANGLPVEGASVKVTNNQVDPPIVIDELTNNSGLLQLVGVPPGNFAYNIKVTKGGYSSSQTYPIDDPDNPNPVLTDATVVAGVVTQISLAIDQTSTIVTLSHNQVCGPIGSIDFTLRGTKLIGTDPDLVKYETNQVTNSTGSRSISGLEWDSYSVDLNEAGYHLIGTIPILPLTLPPAVAQTLSLALAPSKANGVLVIIRDGATGLPLDGAEVNLDGEIKITDRGFWHQTDWSGGAGQADFLVTDQYALDDGNIDLSVSGQISLREVLGNFVPGAQLDSSIFDTGATSTTYHKLTWQPDTQPGSVGPNSLRFQIATAAENTATTTWNFIGPDGTAGSYYDTSDQELFSGHDGQRYLRYRVYLSTIEETSTPSLADVILTYGNGCIPPGQVYFGDIADGAYPLSVSRDGYQAYSNPNVIITQDWQKVEINLLPL